MSFAKPYTKLPLNNDSTDDTDTEDSIAILIDDTLRSDTQLSSATINSNQNSSQTSPIVTNIPTLKVYFQVYYLVFALLGNELCVAKLLAFANIFLSIALLAEPVLFGKVINVITSISSKVCCFNVNYQSFALPQRLSQ